MRRTSSLRKRLAKGCCVVAFFSASTLPGFIPLAVAQVPGLETFMKEPETPLELWEAADYLIRSGQVKQAVPYLNKFLKGKPDDATILSIRDRFGAGSILRLDDHPETRAIAAQMTSRMADASQRQSRHPERIQRFVGDLTKTHEEQEHAMERLRESGPYSVPHLITALDRPDLTDGEHGFLLRNLGQHDSSAVPPLLASLDSLDAKLVADVVTALGMIGDPRSLSELFYMAAKNDASTPTGGAARRAIAALTGESFDSQPRSAVRFLTDEARRYHTHAVRFPGESVILWHWDPATKIPVHRQVSRTDAEGYLGMRLARQALDLDPANVPAQVVLLSIALEKAAERAGAAAYISGNDPLGVMATALASGPDVLGLVLRTAIADGKMDLAAVAATALGQVADRTALADSRRVNPLVEALTAPSRRVQFAAARALVLLDPRKSFPGSSQVVPILARFVTNQAAPRAIVIDGNAPRGSLQTGFLHSLGYDPTLAMTGKEGFRVAAESADVEILMIDSHLVAGDWRLVDTISNLRADARTAGIPIYVYGPLAHQVELHSLFENYPGVKFVVTPMTGDLLERQLGGRPSGLSDAERATYAQNAAGLLALLSTRPGSPFESDLRRAESALSLALNTPPTSLAASVALGDVPDTDAQRSLADILIDPAKPAQLRQSVAGQLSRSIQRFGPLVSAEQEKQLLTAYDNERDPVIRAAVAAVIGSLRPRPDPIGNRLRQIDVPPAQTAPGTGSVPSPPTPAPTPSDAAAPADAKP